MADESPAVVPKSDFDRQYAANAELYAQNVRLRESIRQALEKIDEASFTLRNNYPGTAASIAAARLALTPKTV